MAKARVVGKRKKPSSWSMILRKVFSPEALSKLRKYAHDVANGADFIEAAHGHICSSKCWHFPGFEDGLVRCSCRWEEGPTYRLYNGSSHEPTCWVHRVYVECGDLQSAELERVRPGLWRVWRKEAP